MTIYYNPAKDASKPASLAIKDRVDDKDVIHLSECLWAISETKISIIGLLGEQSTGIEDYNDKNFKPAGQKVAFSFLHDENPVYDRETRKTTIEPGSPEQKVQFRILHAALTKFEKETNAVCAIAMLRPKVSALVVGAAEAVDEDSKQYFTYVSKNMFVFTAKEPTELTGEDTDFINSLVAQKPSDLAKKSGGWQSTPKETESERLMARWSFIQSHFESVLGEKITTMPQLLAVLNAQAEIDKIWMKEAFQALLELVSK